MYHHSSLLYILTTWALSINIYSWIQALEDMACMNTAGKY